MTDDVRDDGPVKGRSRWKSGCLIAAVAFFGLGLIGVIVGPKEPPKAGVPAASTKTDAPATATDDGPEYTKATAGAIFAAYRANQLAAAKQYADRPLQVSGTIAGIDESFGTPVLALATGNQFMPIRAEFPKSATDQLAATSKGDTVVVKCQRLYEAGGFLSLKDCTL